MCYSIPASQQNMKKPSVKHFYHWPVDNCCASWEVNFVVNFWKNMILCLSKILWHCHFNQYSYILYPVTTMKGVKHDFLQHEEFIIHYFYPWSRSFTLSFNLWDFIFLFDNLHIFRKIKTCIAFVSNHKNLFFLFAWEIHNFALLYNALVKCQCCCKDWHFHVVDDCMEFNFFVHENDRRKKIPIGIIIII